MLASIQDNMFDCFATFEMLKANGHDGWFRCINQSNLRWIGDMKWIVILYWLMMMLELNSTTIFDDPTQNGKSNEKTEKKRKKINIENTFKIMYALELKIDLNTDETDQVSPFGTQSIRSDFFEALCINFIEGHTQICEKISHLPINTTIK